jgi:hypothetical protein
MSDILKALADTKAKRRTIYMKAFGLLKSTCQPKEGTFRFVSADTTYSVMGVCEILMDVIGGRANDYERLNLFPEWDAQRPQGSVDVLWWPVKDRDSREKALLKAIELCESKNRAI